MANRKESKKAMLNDTSSNQISELLATTAVTMTTTAALVGMHHYYRKRQQPSARWHDYIAGINAQLHSLPKLPLSRLSHAYQHAKLAYQSYPKYDTSVLAAQDNEPITHHTTTLLPRPLCWVSGVAAMPKHLNKEKNDNNAHDFGVVGIDADRHIVWQTTMPERVHDIVVQPITAKSEPTKPRNVVVMGRRPSERFWVLDTTSGQVQHAIKADCDRHFYGHACYSLDGTQLYITENDTVSLTGKIGIYDATNGYQKIGEFNSEGIGPHELIMHPDNKTLIVANGGIKTEQASREELNLDTMRPSLVYLDRYTGELLEQITPEHNQMSIRHLAIHSDGTVMIGIQFQGERHINVPLVLTHRRGDSAFRPLIMPNNQWQRFHQYIASVAVNSEQNQLCVTTPIGGCAAIYDLTTRKLIDAVSLPDCAGASIATNCATLTTHISADDDNDTSTPSSGFIVSDGQGQLTTLLANSNAITDSNAINNNAKTKTPSPILQNRQHHKMSFDNHLQAL